MYEPWGERKFRVNLRDFKEKLKEKLKSLKTSKWFAVAITLIILAGLGSYTGYVSYASVTTKLNSQIMILQKQLKACQANLTSYSSKLKETQDELSTYKSKSQECESNLEATKAELDECNSAKEELSSSLQEIKGSIEEWKSKYEEAQSNYENLQNKQESLTCNYAKDVCGTRGMNYYFVSGDRIVCCLRNDPDYCIETPPSGEAIKEITC